MLGDSEPHNMNYTEEHVTRAVSRQLIKEGWEIVAVHPPDGQGPFVIPKAPKVRAIERSSYHPDVVAIRAKQKVGAEIMIVECKLKEVDLAGDLDKLRKLALSRFSLLFALYRCQRFDSGPDIGVELDHVSTLPTQQLPVQFGLAALSTMDSVSISMIEGFTCTKFLFSETSILA